MYLGEREDSNVETTKSPGSTRTMVNTGLLETTQLWTKGQQTSTTCHPQSIMMIHSTPTGERIHCESYLINTEADRSALNDVVLGTFPDFTPTKKCFKSTTDIPCRGNICLLPPCTPAVVDKEQNIWRRCSLNETNNVSRFSRHALSVPNMGSCCPLHFNSSPLQSSPLSPAHSDISSPGREIERLSKARGKLLESQSNHTPRRPPEIREQLRYVSKDGKCRVNLGHIDERGRFLSDIFTSFVDLQYRWFLFVFMMCYITTWFFFAVLYYVNASIRGDLGQPLGTNPNQEVDINHCYLGVDGFISALLFSVETQRTIGFGSRTVSPTCHEGVLLVMMQCIVGSMIDALMVGCMFVKISRPKKRAETLLFSRTCVIANRDDQLCLMFRIGDLRESHMVDAKVRAKLIKSRQTAEGEFLPLEQTEINLGYETGSDRLFLVEPQVIKHNIDINSPLWELGPEQLRRLQFEIIVILEGIVEATGMMCQAKTSYIETEIEWGARFEPCMTLEKGSFRVDLSRFHTTYKVPLPNCSASQAHQLTVLAGCNVQSHTACRDWEAGTEGTTIEDKDKSQSNIRFTIGDIQEERMSQDNESEASAEQMQ